MSNFKKSRVLVNWSNQTLHSKFEPPSKQSWIRFTITDIYAVSYFTVEIKFSVKV